MSVAAVLVNHNTSAFAELAVRSLFHNNRDVDLSLTIFDNDSSDDQEGLLAAAQEHAVEVIQSGFNIHTPGNSHGEVLSRFVLDPRRATAEHLLFLDADVCFTRPGTLTALLAAMEAHPQAFGVGPRMSWDGETPLPAEVASNPNLYRDRLHPCCALVRNSEVFRSVVEHLGLSCARLLLAEEEVFLDTFAVMTKAMRTHGLEHLVVEEALVMHAFAVSYPDGSSGLLSQKQARRDEWLTRMREQR